MREFIVSTDSTSDLTDDFFEAKNVQLHPLHYLIDGVEYGKEIGPEPSLPEFYGMLKEGKMPTTNATSLDYDIKLFSAAAEAGKDILHISFSSAMSTSYNNAVIAAGDVKEQYPDVNIRVIDSKSGSGGTGLLVREAVKLLEAGKSVDEAADIIESYVPNTNVYFTVPDLMSLCRGGRLSKTSAVLGTALKIQPTLYIDENGSLAVLNKVRGRKAAMKFLLDTLEPLKEKGKLPDAISLGHGDCEADCETLKQMIKDTYGIEEVYIHYLCQTLGSHTGCDIITFSFIEK